MPAGRDRLSGTHVLPRRLRAALAVLCAMLPAASGAAAECTLGGAAYSSGASACIPRLQGSEVVSVLHACDQSRWVSQDVACPDRFAYFCKVGPYAMEVGETFLLGTGPQAIQCVFPGVLTLASAGTADGPSTLPQEADPAPPSKTVQRVQAFLSAEGTGADFGLACGGPDCSGKADAATIGAVAAHITRNLENLTPEERTRFGVAETGNATADAGRLNPIDLFPLFAETFDVPSSD